MATNPGDRTVHAIIPDGGMIVRYDRAGKWYLEYPARTGRPRAQINLAKAVELALDNEDKDGCRIYMNYAGGSTFDARVRKLKAARATAARRREPKSLKAPEGPPADS